MLWRISLSITNFITFASPMIYQNLIIYGIPFFLSLDIFFLSISGGVTLQPYRWSSSLKVSIVFSLSQIIAGFIGLLISSLILPLISEFSFIAGVILVGFFGSKMMQEAVKVKNEERTYLIENNEILYPLALASSLNTFVIFVGLGFLEASYIISLSVLFISIFFVSQFGQFIGSHYKPIRLGRSSKLLGGFLIIVLLILKFIL